MIVILFCFLLIPAFQFTSKYGDQGWMIMLTSFFGLTNGYLTVCVYTLAPKGYKVLVFAPLNTSNLLLCIETKMFSSKIIKCGIIDNRCKKIYTDNQ